MPSMSNTDVIIHDLEIMSGATNYKRWMLGQFTDHIGKRIIELGAGIGNFTEMFLDKEIIITVDNHEPCIEYMKKRFSNHNNIIPLKFDISDEKILDLRGYKADTIICINVLEHVRDDRKAIFNMFNLLDNGGKLALLVPAFQSLYGSIDRIVGHYRRYGKIELKRKLTGAGFDIKDIFYMNSIAVIGWFLNNRLFHRKKESPSQVMIFDSYVVPWLKIIEHLIRPPFGLSLVAICEKRQE